MNSYRKTVRCTMSYEDQRRAAGEQGFTELASLAAYANSAEMNVLNLLDEISVREGRFKNNQKSQGQIKGHSLLKSLSDSKQARRAKRIVHYLERHFSFVRPLQGIISEFLGKENTSSAPQTLEPEDYQNFFESFFALLHDVRNALSHYEHSFIPSLNKNQWLFLGRAYDAAYRCVKEEKVTPSSDNVKHLVRRGKDNDNPDFSPLFVTPGPAANSDSNSESESDPDSEHLFLTRDGILFFLCLFLSKDEGYKLLKQMQGFKDERTIKKQARLRIFTCFALRPGKQRLDGSAPFNKETLLLDMLGEFTRCPKALYERLHDSDRDDFQVTLELNENGKDEDRKSDEEGALPLIRYRSRFVLLMLEFLDRDGAWSNHPSTRSLAAALDMGDFYFATYGKTLYAQEQSLAQEETRRLKKKVIRYAPLDEREEWKKPELWKALENKSETFDDENPEPYIVPTRPHYHLPEQNIYLHPREAPYFFEPERRNMPDDQIRYKPPANHTAHFCLSQYELVNLAFYHYLCRRLDRTQYSLCSLLYAYRGAIHRLFNAVIDPVTDNRIPESFGSRELLDQWLKQEKKFHFLDFPLKSDYLPEVLLNHLFKKPTRPGRLKQATNTLQLFQKETELLQQGLKLDRQEKSKENNNRAGERHQRILKAGKMADFLARDILRLQPVNSLAQPGKANSLQFAELQARLAFYGRDKGWLPPLFQEMGLLDQDSGHPFLKEVQKKSYTGLIDFYQAYLEQRRHYLNALADELKRDGEKTLKRLERHTWLMPRATPGSEKLPIKAYLERLKKHPLNLPRGVFTEPCWQLLKEIENGKHAEVFTARPHHTGQLIHDYFQHVRQDSYPEMYDYARNTPLVDKWLDKRQGAALRQPLRKHYCFITEGRQEGKCRQGNTASVFNPQAIKDWLQTKPEAEQLKRLRQIAKRDRKPADDATLHQKIATQRKQAYRAFLEEERELRHLRTEDQVMFLAATALMQDTEIGQGLAQLQLKNATKTLLETRIPYQLQVPQGLSGVPGYSHVKTIQVGNIRVKDLGKYRHMLRNRLLYGLLHYCTAEAVNYEAVRYELERYAEMRRQALELILKFEKKHPLPAGTTKDMTGMHRQLLNHYFTQPLSEEDLRRKNEMLALRNAFCHNQYPNVDDARTWNYGEAHGLFTEARQAFAAAPAENGVPEGVSQWFFERLSQHYQ